MERLLKFILFLYLITAILLLIIILIVFFTYKSLFQAEKQILSTRYSIDIIPEVGYIEVEKIEKKKVVKVREKVRILAVSISQNNEIMYLLEKDGKRFYKLKKEVYA